MEEKYERYRNELGQQLEIYVYEKNYLDVT